MEKQLYICNNAIRPLCEHCLHSVPHEMISIPLIYGASGVQLCEKFQCVKVKEDSIVRKE